MVRSELVAKLLQENPHLSQADAKRLLDTIFDRIADTVAKGGRVELRDFGTFTPKTIKARVGRNPRNGEAVNIPERTRMWFTAGKGLRDRMNGIIN